MTPCSISPDSNNKDDWHLERQALDWLGYTAPLPLSEPERADAVLTATTLTAGYARNPHLRNEAIFHLLEDEGLRTAIRRLCGPRFRLWRSAYFRKVQGSGEIGWHHDKHFFSDGVDNIRLDEIGTHYSILFALTDIVPSTGVLEVIPGTHRPMPGLDRDERPFHQRPPESHILKDLPQHVVAQARPVPIPAGSFLVFHSALLHRSQPHAGGVDRLGLAIRLVRDGIDVPSELAEPDDVHSLSI